MKELVEELKKQDNEVYKMFAKVLETTEKEKRLQRSEK